jgi:drug/metabolite transporter (DMT)-like permease
LKKSAGNIATYLSVVLWSAVWAFAMQCENVPLLLLAGSIALVWGALAAIEALIKGAKLSSFKISGGKALFEAFGGNGFRLTAFPAVLMIDPIEAANLSCVWLGFAIVFGLLATGSALSRRHIAGMLCFAGGAIAIAYDGVGTGHVLALASGLIWGWYILKCALAREEGRQADALGNLAAGGFLIYLSLLIEAPWDVTARDLYWLCGLIFTECAGYLLWIYGARHGDTRKAKISVLFTPIGALIWICMLGGFTPTAMHIAITATVTLAGLILSPHLFRAVKTERVE